MEDTKYRDWTIHTSEHDDTVSAYRPGERWEFTGGELCAEVTDSEERVRFGSGCPSNRYLPAAVLLDMMRRAGLIPGPGSKET